MSINSKAYVSSNCVVYEWENGWTDFHEIGPIVRNGLASVNKYNNYTEYRVYNVDGRQDSIMSGYYHKNKKITDRAEIWDAIYGK